MSETRTALVLGATGGIGGETAAALIRRGWSVRAMARNPQARAAGGQDPLAGVEWTSGDAMRPADVLSAARGASVIVHGVNPPGYRGWSRLVLPMIDNTIAAAKAVGARIVLPGTVYNYGRDAFPGLVEDAPQRPFTKKGRIRVELERRLEAASAEGAPALIVRFGDFFGPSARNNWFSQGLVQPGARLTVIRYPGRPGVGHAWAYLPDAAEAIVRLLGSDRDLGAFARFHFAGTWDPDGRLMTGAVQAAFAPRRIRVAGLPWGLLRLAGLAMETPRELCEMRYLWEEPVRLDNTRLVARLGEEPHTPLEAAVRATLNGLGVT